MSAGAKAWNAYIDKFGKEPTSSQQLQNYAKGESSLDNLNYKSARDAFNNNKGNGRIDGIDDANTKSKSKNNKPPPPKTKTKKTKSKSKSKPPPIPKPTLVAPTAHNTVPSGSEYEEDENNNDEYEYYYEDEQKEDNNNKSQPPAIPNIVAKEPKKKKKSGWSFKKKEKNKTQENKPLTPPTALPPPNIGYDQDESDHEYDGNPTGVLPMETNDTKTKKKGLFGGFGRNKNTNENESEMDGNENEVTTGLNDNASSSTTPNWQPTPSVQHYGYEINYTGDRLHDKKSHTMAYFALALSIVALAVSILGTSIVAGVLHSKLSSREETMTSPDLSYDGLQNRDESQNIDVGGYWGWNFNYGRDVEYKNSEGEGYVSGTDVQYPFPDIHVTYGDVLIFKRRTSWPPDDLYLVPQQVFDSCNFSYPFNLTNENGDMDNTSALWLADSDELYCAPQYSNGYYLRGSACQYEFPIEDWSDYEINTEEEGDDLFGELISSDTLYFISSFYWDRSSRWQSCRGGLKVKVHINRKRRKLMHLKRSSDAWREIGNQEVVKSMQASIGHISRQLILQQFNSEQRVRSEGDSGLTNVRGVFDGDAAYDDGTYTNGAIASIHDHSDNILVVGIGEISAVLNGVEFTTRHNDYNLNMPSLTDTRYGKTQPIPYPDVPPQVTAAGGVNNQILEMQEWFRAFQTQNKSHRNYTDFFKPILCYLEGTWRVDQKSLEEPFESDRHAIDARTWKQLHDKIRWMMNSGRKNSLENLAHLPSAVRTVVNDTYPVISNWEYRILCAPLKNDIPTSRFRVVNDLSVQLMGSPSTREELYFSRRSRFELSRYINLKNPNGDHRWSAGRKRWNYLDYLMEQIPGKDNWNANLTDILPDGTDMSIHYNTDSRLNSGYYSRFFGLDSADAMGSSKHRRGWSDRNFFAAQTTQTEVSAVQFNFEQEDADGRVEYIDTVSRWSYAIPLEIVYQTPLSRWNPHNIAEVDRNDFDYARSGACSEGKAAAFNGWTINNAYFTPAAFYQGLTQTSSADTASDNVCAIGSDGNAYPVYASGHWITFPEIGNGIGKVRQRYPIFPIHNAGSPAFKEIKALQDVVLPDNYDDPIANPNGFFGDSRDLIYGFEINLQGGGHQHVVYVPGWRVGRYWFDGVDNDIALMSDTDVIAAESDTRNNHAHTIEIWRNKDVDDQWVYHLKRCRPGSISDDDQYSESDWMADKCSDNHDAISRE